MPKLTDIPYRKICNKETYSIFLFDAWFSILVCFLFSESSFVFVFFHLRSVSGQRLPVDTISLRNIKFQLPLIQLWCDIQRLTRNKFISELNPNLLSATVSPGILFRLPHGCSSITAENWGQATMSSVQSIFVSSPIPNKTAQQSSGTTERENDQLQSEWFGGIWLLNSNCCLGQHAPTYSTSDSKCRVQALETPKLFPNPGN